MKIIKKVDKSELRDFMYNKFQNCADDEKLYEALNNGKAINVFQMSAGTASQVVDQIHPDNLSEMTACNAFARPGTISGVPNYVDGKSGNLKYKNPIINSVFNETFGVCLYQEQIIQLTEKLSPLQEIIRVHLENGTVKEYGLNDKVNTNNGVKLAKDLTGDDEIL